MTVNLFWLINWLSLFYKFACLNKKTGQIICQ